MKLYLDSQGIIVQQNGDGGDAMARMAMFWLLPLRATKDVENRASILSMEEFLNKTDVGGDYSRYPLPPYNDPRDFSGDQTRALLAYLDYDNDGPRVRAILKNIIKNYGRYQNNDLAYGDLSLFIRTLEFKWLYPVLFLTDICLLINSLILCFWSTRRPGKILTWLGSHVSWIFTCDMPPNSEGVPQAVHGPDNCSNDINHTLALIRAANTMATPLSWISRLIYAKFRPRGVQYAWDTYFSPQSGANPFNVLYEPYIAFYF